jgi:hypothetical protein
MRTKEVITTKATRQGIYNVVDLLPGIYNVRVSGFTLPPASRDVIIAPGSCNRLNFAFGDVQATSLIAVILLRIPRP